jgi:hypothetical protein
MLYLFFSQIAGSLLPKARYEYQGEASLQSVPSGFGENGAQMIRIKQIFHHSRFKE